LKNMPGHGGLKNMPGQAYFSSFPGVDIHALRVTSQTYSPEYTTRTQKKNH
jgi:hypothetical protein